MSNLAKRPAEDPSRDWADDETSMALALAEAEAAEAESRAAVARAKAKAVRSAIAAVELGEGACGPEEAEPDSARRHDRDGMDSEILPATRAHWWTRLPWSRLALGAGVLALCAVLAATGLMVRYHHQASTRRSHDAEFVSAARHGVEALLSIDYTNARADVQQVIDASTGSFRDDFAKNADDFTKAAQESKGGVQGRSQGCGR